MSYSYLFAGAEDKETFVGIHYLSGVDFDVNGVGNGIRFILDGKAYEIVEDEDDGYRSSAQAVRLTDAVISNTFSPVKVFVSTRDDDNIMVIQDGLTGKTIIEVGTEDHWDYYPSFIHSFDPTAMAINQEVK
jgi:hypothetical protein